MALVGEPSVIFLVRDETCDGEGVVIGGVTLLAVMGREGGAEPVLAVGLKRAGPVLVSGERGRSLAGMGVTKGAGRTCASMGGAERVGRGMCWPG